MAPGRPGHSWALKLGQSFIRASARESRIWPDTGPHPNIDPPRPTSLNFRPDPSSGTLTGMTTTIPVPLNESRRGFFLALDGPDGGGKTTQAAHLINWLRLHEIDVVACRDPGGTALGDRLRAILLDRHDTAISMRSEMLLYMASRAQLVEEVIEPALDAGKFVVCDRYLLANVVYQGYAGGLPVDEMWTVGAVAIRGLMPDLTILIDVPPEVARTRIGEPRDRIEDRPDDFRDAVRRGYLRAAESYPAPLALIDGSANAESIASQIQSEVTRALGSRSRS